MVETKQYKDWIKVILAGLPHLVFVLVDESPRLVYYTTSVRIARDIPLLTFSALIVAALIFAWRQHWPRWAASWIGYGLVMIYFIPSPSEGYTLMGWLHSQISNDLSNLFFYIQILCSLWVGLLLAGRDRPSGLLVALPVVTVVWSWLTLDVVHSAVGIPLFIGVAIMTAVATMAVMRAKQVRDSLIAALTTNFSIVFAMAYVRLYHSTYLPKPTIMEAVASIVFHLVLSSILITGPLWGWMLWKSAWQLLATQPKTEAV